MRGVRAVVDRFFCLMGRACSYCPAGRGVTGLNWKGGNGLTPIWYLALGDGEGCEEDTTAGVQPPKHCCGIGKGGFEPELGARRS